MTAVVSGDLEFEADETFTVGLSNAVDATIADNSGTGTIANDDAEPTLSIADNSTAEGSSLPKFLVFTVTLTGVTGDTVRVDFATADGTAIAGEDYTAASGTLTFAPGDTTRTASVTLEEWEGA